MAIPSELISGISALNDLPSPSDVAQQILTLALDDDATLDDLANTLEKDAALTAKCLRIANSPLYRRGGGDVTSLRKALFVLGRDAVSSICLGVTMYDELTNTQGAWTGGSQTRSIIGAHSFSILNERLTDGGKGEAFTAALLQDMGLYAVFLVERKQGGARSEALAEFESRIPSQYGCNHGEISSWLLERWQFPQALIDKLNTYMQLVPGADDDSLLAARLARVLTEYVANGPETGDDTLRELVSIIDTSELDRDQAQELLTQVLDGLQDTSEAYDLALPEIAVSLPDLSQIH